jgi:hypothetical protein
MHIVRSSDSIVSWRGLKFWDYQFRLLALEASSSPERFFFAALNRGLHGSHFFRRPPRIFLESRAIQALPLTFIGIKTDNFCQECTRLWNLKLYN